MFKKTADLVAVGTPKYNDGLKSILRQTGKFRRTISVHLMQFAKQFQFGGTSKHQSWTPEAKIDTGCPVIIANGKDLAKEGRL